MIYIKWTEQDIAKLNAFDEISVLYTAIDSEGNVQKEIGLNNEGKAVHKSPSNNYPYGKYGIFDNQKVILSNDNTNITEEEFENLWANSGKE